MSAFGWDLPPGCSQRDIDEAFGGGEDCPCEVCGGTEYCDCPECPECGLYGAASCYQEHGLILTRMQKILGWENTVKMAENLQMQRVAEDHYASSLAEEDDYV